MCVSEFLYVLTAFQACEALFNTFLERQVFTQISDVVQAVVQCFHSELGLPVRCLQNSVGFFL